LPDVVVSDAALVCDTLLVAGAPTAPRETHSQSLLTWLKATAKRSRRYGSVCTGAFALAAGGLLDRRRVTTHWAEADLLAQRYPLLTVEMDALYVKDGKVRTAAGVTAGLDLALSLVEEDLGRDIAMRVAAQLVMYFKRPGGQMQFSRRGVAQPMGRSVLQEVQRWVVGNPALPHSVEDLAHRAGLSARHFARLFAAEVGTTPGAWIEAARIGAAREMLEVGTTSPKQVAAACGFANADTLRRTFFKHLGVTPAQYRRQHGTVDKTSSS
jgi:transcriptional regulator GlxA family with amidase domain